MFEVVCSIDGHSSQSVEVVVRFVRNLNYIGSCTACTIMQFTFGLSQRNFSDKNVHFGIIGDIFKLLVKMFQGQRD